MELANINAPVELNGVNVTDVENLAAAIVEDPGLAQSHFRLKNTWVSGGFNQSEIGSFYTARQELRHAENFSLYADEPPLLAGSDKAPNPVEHLLNALASCLTTTFIYHAAIRGIEIEELEATLEGDLDLRGFFGISTDVRRGYENIRVQFKVKTEEENLEKLKALSTLSPVYDTVRNGTNVDLSIMMK